MNYAFNKFIGATKPVNYRIEIFSGLTVALALVPEAIAFAMIAGLSPLTGLYAAVVMGFVTSVLGGRPGMISAATGAVAVVLVGLIMEVRSVFPDITNDEVLHYVFATVILAGIMQIIVGALRLGKFIRLVPQPVMYGFVNGLAVIIFIAQLPNITSIIDKNPALAELFKGNIEVSPMLSEGVMQLGTMLVLIMLTIGIIWLLPKFNKALPASLTAVLVVSSIVILFGIDTPTVSDRLLPNESISGTFPPLSIPSIPLTWATLILILPYAAIVAGVGLIESLLTLQIVDEVTETRGRGNKECVAQGIANICSGFLSGMGGCAMVGQSMINTSSGARTRISGIVASLMLLVFVMYGSSLIGQLPLAALVGLMFMVAFTTFEWASLKAFNKMPASDVFVMISVTLIIVFTDNLVAATVLGVIFSALAYAWESAKRIRARKFVDDHGVKHYEIYGPLFFASTSSFLEKFDPTGDPDEVVVDFEESRIADMSAIAALNTLTERYRKHDKQVRLRHLSEDCRHLLANANAIIDVNIEQDPTYRVPTDVEF